MNKFEANKRRPNFIVYWKRVFSDADEPQLLRLKQRTYGDSWGGLSGRGKELIILRVGKVGRGEWDILC